MDWGKENARMPIAQGETVDKAHPNLEGLIQGATDASNFLKALGNEGRLMILCYLASGPKSVTALEQLLDSRQSAVSQNLARLRLEGMVEARREGQVIFYSIRDEKVRVAIDCLAELFCKPD
jgi:DNA-binding transcriptional ArsR family regulator